MTNVVDIGFHHPALLIVANVEGETLRIVMANKAVVDGLEGDPGSRLS